MTNRPFTEQVCLTRARADLGPLARWVAVTHQRVAITSRGRLVAVLVSADELARLDAPAGTRQHRRGGRVSSTHAVELALTGPATEAQVAALSAAAPGRYAFCHQRRRAAVLTADTAQGALEQARAQATAAALPLDVVWSLYPDKDGLVQLCLELNTDVRQRLRERAGSAGETLDAFVNRALREGLRQDNLRRRAAIRSALGPLLARHSPKQVLRALLVDCEEPDH